MIQTDLRYRFHNQHLPLTPSVQRQGAFMGTNHGGSSVDASVDASMSLNVSGHVVRCGHLSGLMMRLV